MSTEISLELVADMHNKTPEFSRMPPDATHWAPHNQDTDFLSGWYKENEGESKDTEDEWVFKFNIHDSEWSGSTRNDGFVQPIYKFVEFNVPFEELQVGDILQNTESTSFSMHALVKITDIVGEMAEQRVHIVALNDAKRIPMNFGKSFYQNNYHFIYRPGASVASSENDWVNQL